jgi:hypothetical protein
MLLTGDDDYVDLVQAKNVIAASENLLEYC